MGFTCSCGDSPINRTNVITRLILAHFREIHPTS
ncbi:Uncharacterised protein [Vibrio cholerae]|nr:Uncharacterised protein [Vibrio cholerae]